MQDRKTKAISKCHVRIYSEDKLLVAMDSDIEGNVIAKLVFDKINGEYDEGRTYYDAGTMH